MLGYHYILVAVDGSEASLQALEEALRIPADQFLAVAVPQAEEAGRVIGEPAHPDTVSWESASRALVISRNLAKNAGVHLETSQRAGKPHELIVSLARSQGCDLIVVGRRGLTLSDKVMMGSVTARVIGLSPVDVLVVPRHNSLSFETMLLATDGSRYSRQAATRSLNLAQSFGSNLHILAVLDVHFGSEHGFPEATAALCHRLEELVAEVTDQAESLGVTCQGWVRQGAAYREIVNLAQELGAHLIIMGSHGRTGLKRLLMGSVTERVIGHAPSPVLVVRS